MKKVLIGIIVYIVFLFIYFLQADFFSWFTIAGIMPNLFVILILILGLFSNRIFSMIMAILIGLTIDFTSGRTIGISAIMLCVIGFIAGYFDKNFSKESKLTIMLMVAGVTVIYEIGSYFLNILFFEMVVEMKIFLKILAIEVIYNMIITIIIYKLILKLGYMMERQFKVRNILTRYF